jgi:outer membrane protein assembly factor BamA
VFRDDVILPTSGVALAASQELAGLGGDVLYFKNLLVRFLCSVSVDITILKLVTT